MLAVDRLVFDMYDQRPGDYATHVEEAEASFVLYVGMLYVGMRRLFDDPWVEEGHRSASGPWTIAAARLTPICGLPVSTTATPDRFTPLPDEHALQATVTALEEHGFSVEVVGDLDAVRQAVAARIAYALGGRFVSSRVS